MPPRWMPPASIIDHLEYSNDNERVRCLICSEESVSGLGTWIKRQQLKKHLQTASHISCLRNREEREAKQTAHETRLNQPYNASSSLPLNIQATQSSHRIPMFPAEPDAGNDWEPHNSAELSAVDYHRMATELQPALQQQRDPLSAEEEAERISQQFRDLLLKALAADGLDKNVEGGTVDVEDLMIEEEDLLDAGENDQDEAEDLNLLNDSEYHPYPNKTVMLLDILDNLGRCRFSSAQITLILLLARELGVQNVPSYKMFRKFQEQLRPLCGRPPQMYTSSFGNIFYMNDIRDTIARDFSNPQVAKHMQLYPEETTGPISETWQAKRWKEYDPSQLTPMYSHGLQRFWIEELCQLKDGRFVIPHNWITVNGVLHSDTSIAVQVDGTWNKSGEKCRVPAMEFKSDYNDLVSHMGEIIWAPDADIQSMPNKMRDMVDDDEDLYVVMVSPWADDVSGNRSKQYNKHMNMYASNGCLPGRLLQQEFHVHYVSTSPTASSPEQFSALRDQIQETEKKPFKCYNANTGRKCAFILRAPGLPADNPQQSEEASHIGAQGNHPCRKCKWGGPEVYKESEEGFHTCHLAGIAREAGEIRAQLDAQLRQAMYGVATKVEAMQKETGTKDKVTQYWILRLIKKAKETQSIFPHYSEAEVVKCVEDWFDDQPGDKMNPLLNVTGLDPSQDTPVELLHTILLGVIKYIWHLLNTSQWSDANRQLLAIRLQSCDLSGLSVPPIRASYMIQYRNNLIGKHFKTLMQVLAFTVHGITTPEQFSLVKAAGELGARLWVPCIDNMEEYLSDLETLIANVLDAFDQVDPLRILVKIKLHLLPHMVDDIRRYGPLIRCSTEIYESYNSVFRQCSILSNHLAPSRDISYKFASFERVKHLFTGGYFWSNEKQRWVQAGSAVLSLIRDEPAFQRHLGWVDHTPKVTESTIIPSGLHGTPPIAWGSTEASKISTLFPAPLISSSWQLGARLLVANGDVVTAQSWVFCEDEQGRSFPGRILELLVYADGMDPSLPHPRELVTVETFVISDERHVEFGWPVLRRPRGEDITVNHWNSHLLLKPQNIKFKFSALHDCRLHNCKPSTLGKERQERQETNRDIKLIRHEDDDHFILNLAALHNFVEVHRTINRELTRPIPLVKDRDSFHREMSKKATILRTGKRQKTADKKRENAAKKQKEAVEAAAQAAAAVVEIEAQLAAGTLPLDDSDAEMSEAEREETLLDLNPVDDDTVVQLPIIPSEPPKKTRKRRRK